MAKRVIFLLVLATVVGLPFLLRPERPVSSSSADTVVVVTPHNEAIRHEFGLGFSRWYLDRTGRPAIVDWRVVGGTGDIARYLDGEYASSFRNLWTGRLGGRWSAEIQAGYVKPDAVPSEVRRARAAFLASDVGCGMDLFFGGSPFDFDRQDRAGRLVNSGLGRIHPDWFNDAVLPEAWAGSAYRGVSGTWFGTVLSTYGIIFNRDSLRRLGVAREPEQWSDLADPRFFGEIGLCDPTKSGSMAAAFESIVQQAIRRRLSETAGGTGPATSSERAVREGWIDALRLIQRLGANARYFTDSSQKAPIDVANGDCAAGLCIDFYGREQQEAVLRRGGGARVGYVSPAGGASYSVDPIALLRGAPHRPVAAAFMEYVLSLEGQKLWSFRTGTPGGPVDFALRRLPVRRDFYGHPEWLSLRSDPHEDPYGGTGGPVYHPEWTGPVFLELAFIVRTMDQDTRPELARAWKAILEAPEPRRSRAVAVLQDLSFVDYDSARGPIKAALNSKDQVEALKLARELGDRFRANYREAEGIAVGASQTFRSSATNAIDPPGM